MSFATAQRTFAKQAAAHRAASYGGTVEDGTCDANGNNLSVSVNGTATPFRAAFSVFANERAAMDAGFERTCQARALIPDSLDLTLAIGDVITALASGEGFVAGDTFIINWTLKNPIAAETRIGMRKTQ